MQILRTHDKRCVLSSCRVHTSPVIRVLFACRVQTRTKVIRLVSCQPCTVKLLGLARLRGSLVPTCTRGHLQAGLNSRAV